MSFDMSADTSAPLSSAVPDTADDTSTYDPLSGTTIFTPEFTRNFTPNLDPAYAPETEYVIYRCGTIAPGQTHEPCQHSTTMVLCCECAGCLNELWSCQREVAAQSWLTWRIARLVQNPWVLLVGLVIEAYAMVQLVY